MEKVLIIVPAFNEAENIRGVINKLRSVNARWDVLVINDCSTDNTSAIAKETGHAAVIDLPVNLGIGESLQLVQQADELLQHAHAPLTQADCLLVGFDGLGPAATAISRRYGPPSGVRVVSALAMFFEMTSMNFCCSAMPWALVCSEPMSRRTGRGNSGKRTGLAIAADRRAQPGRAV